MIEWDCDFAPDCIPTVVDLSGWCCFKCILTFISRSNFDGIIEGAKAGVPPIQNKNTE